MVNEIYFVTGNKNKQKEIEKIFGEFNVKFVNLDLPEIQGDVHDITKNKCEAAFKRINKPVIVDDTSLCLNGFNGLPGPYIKYFLKQIGPRGLYQMLKGFDDKSASAFCLLAYKKSSDSEVKIFVGECKGEIVEPTVDNGFGFDCIFRPKNFVKTYSELSNEEKNKISHRRIACDKLLSYLK